MSVADTQQQVIDDLLAAVETSDRAAVELLGRRLATGWAAGELYLGTNVKSDPSAEVDSGMLLRFSEYAHLCEERKGEIDLLERHCSSARFDELLQGAHLTGVERRLLNAAIGEERLEAPEGESWQITKVQGTSGASAYIACVLKGSAMEGVSPDLIGVFSDLPSARQSVEALGYVSVEDFQQRVNKAHP
jgi:hypothetical protein